MMFKPAVTISVDPGSHAGIAAITDEIVYVSDIRKMRETDPWKRIDFLQEALRACGVSMTEGGRVEGGQTIHFVTEAQYVSSIAKRSALVVSGHASAWEVAAQLVGGTNCYVQPRVAPVSWQAMIGAAKGKSRDRKHRAARVLIDHDRRFENLGQGAIDAILIGIYSHAIANGWSGKASEPIAGWQWIHDAWKEREILDA